MDAGVFCFLGDGWKKESISWVLESKCWILESIFDELASK
ncbi:hypothetical protein QFZ72_005439 [Bacillus sp. V2I10]|nr:hypothetical protein [Bacillus sp. V2I10]